MLGLFPIENVKSLDNDEDLAEGISKHEDDASIDGNEESKAMSEMTLVK